MSALLAETVHVARRFTRAVRVDADFSDPTALDGYVCAQSTVEALLLMARHRAATGHGAFTWTGPYGSGKSSLAVALAALAAGADPQAEKLLRYIRPNDRRELVRAFRPDATRWSIAPVVGRREDPAAVIEQTLVGVVRGRCGLSRSRGETLHAWAARIAADRSHAGLLLLVDEMGKFLEGAARGDGDVHLFQELAETAARSGGRLVVVGILHQAFDEYAHRLAREARDEWLKVQGRFLDIPINLAAEEQLDLIGRAIEAQKPVALPVTATVARGLTGSRFGDAATLEERLAACWPLHPLVAALLGPISRRRFGQNQRSLFGFLNSVEPAGFQAFLQTTEVRPDAIYPVARLWDYLHINLEPAILASPDGHRWSTALEALSRAETKGATEAHLALLKAVALIDLFKDRSGLQATPEILGSVLAGGEDAEALLADLARWSVVIYRSHAGTFAIYAGSDFDIEAAVEEARRAGVAVDYRRLAQRAAVQPILAKRHYEATGALRWFEVELTPLHEVEDRVRTYKPAPGAAGLFLLVISAHAEGRGEARKTLMRAADAAGERLVVCGWTRDSYMIREMAADLAALEHVRANRPELEGDAIARREVDARLSRLAADLEDRLSDAIDRVDWFLPHAAHAVIDARVAGPAGLSVLASRLADWRYPQAPRLPNELLNRTKPSSNAQAAVRALLHAMVERGAKRRLGIDNYPPEAGLHMSLLEATGLHRLADDGRTWAFAAPPPSDPANLHPLWAATDQRLATIPEGCSVGDLFTLWRAPPFGLRDGLLPVLLLAYLLSRASQSAVYLEGVFRPTVDTFLVDRLLQDPASVRLRRVELSDVHTDFISALADALSTPDALVAPTALEVARAVVGRVRQLPSWTQRTSKLSDRALVLRDRVKASDDPGRLVLEELPRTLETGLGDLAGVSLARRVLELLAELRDGYPRMLADLDRLLRHELRVRGDGDQGLAALQHRAKNVQGLAGNFRLDALATRLLGFTGSVEDIEGIASLAANKPPRDWVDRDVDAARVELAVLAQQFLKAEGFGRLKDRVDGRVAFAVYISDPRYPEPQSREIELTPEERRIAEALAGRMGALLESQGATYDIAIAALASLGLSLGQPAAPDIAPIAAIA